MSRSNVYTVSSETGEIRSPGARRPPRFLGAGFILMAAMLLTACGPSAKVAPAPNVDMPPPSEVTPGPVFSEEQNSDEDLARTDDQGAVEFVVIPLNLRSDNNEGLWFEIKMNTHSVDLSMDLASLSVLMNDAGVSVEADSWTGGSGHHVSGMLAFPIANAEGVSVIAGAKQLILTIKGVDADVRLFEWNLSGDA